MTSSGMFMFSYLSSIWSTTALQRRKDQFCQCCGKICTHYSWHLGVEVWLQVVWGTLMKQRYTTGASCIHMSYLSWDSMLVQAVSKTMPIHMPTCLNTVCTMTMYAFLWPARSSQAFFCQKYKESPWLSTPSLSWSGWSVSTTVI